ncbi:MAG: hypothetical protein FJ005_05700 [Chloroflexi bacterium]|nr:hypothetical protein [Chloroflexota bacterium]
MLLIDGVKYGVWTPPSEDEFERIAKEHAQDIFGENARYFDLKQKLKTGAGIGSIPDAYVVAFDNAPCWYIVEVELATHPLYEHIVPQITKFVNGIQNPRSQNEIVNAIDDEVADNSVLAAWVKTKIEQTERHKFLANLIAIKPKLVVVINEVTEELREVCDIVSKSLQTKVVELRTFTRQGIGLAVHAHLFEPLIEPSHIKAKPPPPSPIVPLPLSDWAEVTLHPSHLEKHWFSFKQKYSAFFPNFKEPFEIATDAGVFETYIWRDKSGICWMYKNLAGWFEKHSELKVGDKLVIEVIEPMKKYRLRKA